MPPDGQIDLWSVRRDALAPAVLQTFEGWLTAEERDRRWRYRRPVDQKRFLVGRGMLRLLLQHYTGRAAERWTFALNAYGRPAPDPPVSAPAFSLSHTQDMSLCALAAAGPLGADIEAHRSVRHWQIAERFFAAGEAQLVHSAEPSARGEVFLRIWTLKEAYIKALGRGLSIPLDSFCFRLDGPQPHLADPAADAGWHFFQLPLGHAQVAVACSAPRRPQLVRHDLVPRVAELLERLPQE